MVSSKFYFEWLVRYPPLGLLYYGALLKQKGHTVKLLDGELMGYTINHITALAKQFNPDIIFSSVNIYNPQFEFETLKVLKDTLRCHIIARGHFPRLYPEETIVNKQIDFALTGKGFHSVIDITDAIEKKVPFENVKGIIYTDNGNIIKTANEEAFNFDTIPFPARELIDNSVCTTALSKYDTFTTMTASIGCPYSCTYCVDRYIPYQTRSIENVIAEIEECINKLSIKEIMFLDSTFTIDRNWCMHFCNEIIKRKLTFAWAIRTRADLVDDELLATFAKSGCISIHYGIESGNEQILQNLHRNMSLSQIKTAIELTIQKGMEVLGFFMIGNEGETTETVHDTMRFAQSLPLHFAQFNVVFPMPPSDTYERVKKKFGVDIWLEAYKGKNIPPDSCKPPNSTLSLKGLDYFANKAYLMFYLRPKQLWRLLTFKYAPYIAIRIFKILLIHIKQYFKRLSITPSSK
ncbi:MAG: B12-binding domain-containing radical SAM protein [Candidatus Omnitrophica bacterium]|nr:B12-binding domain-containing radical SAM protein [Candidatus Omnitrophota bacterium]